VTPGAKFCHRCGTPADAQAPMLRTAADGNALPWSVAAVALLACIALAAGQRFSRSPSTGSADQEQAPAMSRAPDISQLSPPQVAQRLYDRVMGAAERGRVDSVQFFLPMAMQAYASVGPLAADQRYELGRLAEVAGDATIAGAQADTLLQENRNHLLGLLLASRAARLRNDENAALALLARLAAAEAKERKKELPEYQLHSNDIDQVLTEWRKLKSR
jgi:hypothetical protein